MDGRQGSSNHVNPARTSSGELRHYKGNHRFLKISGGLQCNCKIVEILKFEAGNRQVSSERGVLF